MISYEPLFRTMERKGITSYQLGKMGFPMSTYHSIRRGHGISTNTINMLCRLLDCSMDEILEYVVDDDITCP